MEHTSYNIAVILTCYNRKDKTRKCLEKLFLAQQCFNEKHEQQVQISLFITDDKCTDGTFDVVTDICKNYELTVIEGNGNLYWAGGMRTAWSKALLEKHRWNFYLLLNDDTEVCNNVFDELLNTHKYSLEKYHKAGIYSGITCDIDDTTHITYGGDVFNTKAKGTWHRLEEAEEPRLVDMINANILLVPDSVVEKIGIFPDCYVHSCADTDYCMTARRNNIPALVTAKVCGACEDDHLSKEEECLMLMGMSLNERRKYVNHPTHSDADYLMCIKRNMRYKYPISWMIRKIRLFFPGLYYKISKHRGLYKKTV
jgi:GT2 family glycosyltransferase